VIPFIIYHNIDNQLTLLNNHVLKMILWTIVCVALAIFMFIENDNIWVNEDEYKKMKCKDL